MTHPPTPADHEFQAYADRHELQAVYEPDWNEKLGGRFSTEPDFLVSRDNLSAIAEVREFKTDPLTRLREEVGSGAGAVPPIVTRKPLYWAIRGKAKQLEPFSKTGIPLIIVLANPGGAEVDLGQSELTATMFGGPTTGTSSTYSVESSFGARRVVHEPGYGVFCGTDPCTQPLNRWPHISGIAILEQGVTYYDLNGYRLGSGPAVPEGWFTGRQDRRFGFDVDGLSFGPKPAVNRPLP